MKKHFAMLLVSGLLMSTQALAGNAGDSMGTIVTFLGSGVAITGLYTVGGKTPVTHLMVAGVCLATLGRLCDKKELVRAGIGTWVAAASAMVGNTQVMGTVLPNIPVIGQQFSAAGPLGQNIVGIGVFQMLWTGLSGQVDTATAFLTGN